LQSAEPGSPSVAHLFYFDSGIGGLSGVKATREAGIHAKITYIGDSRRIPYGLKTEEQLDRLGRKGMEEAASLGVDAVVPVCHTWETKAKNHTTLLPANTRYISLIESGAAGVAGEPNVSKVATVSTNATADSGAYAKAIHQIAPHIDVHEVKGHNLAMLIEQRASDKLPSKRPLVKEVERVLGAVPTDVDLVVHACTHYSFVDDEFAKILPANVRRVSSVGYQAQQVKEFLGDRASLGTDETRFFTTGDVDDFRTQVTRLVTILRN